MSFIPFTMVAENQDGDALILTDQTKWICEYSGLNPPKAALYSSAMAGMNGAKYVGSRLNTRNIVLTFTLLRDIPTSRNKLYEFFRTGEYVKLVYAGTKHCWIDGYVETIQADQFKETPHKQVLQVSILCYEPELKDTEETIIAVADFTGDEVFNYGGDIPTGFDIDVSFTGSVTKVVFSLWNETLTINESFASGDTLHICTVNGKKAVEKTSSSVTTNIIGSVQFGSKFPQLRTGANEIAYNGADATEKSYMTVVYTFTPRYEAV